MGARRHRPAPLGRADEGGRARALRRPPARGDPAHARPLRPRRLGPRARRGVGRARLRAPAGAALPHGPVRLRARPTRPSRAPSRRSRAPSRAAAATCGAHVHALPDDGTVPGMPGWTWLHTPGHTAGHVSFWREADRTLLAGDAVATTDLDSWAALATLPREFDRPPAPMTPDWDAAARTSIDALAALAPDAVGAGHGRAITAGTANALHTYARTSCRRPRAATRPHPPSPTTAGIVSLPPSVPDPFPFKVAAGARGGPARRRVAPPVLMPVLRPATPADADGRLRAHPRPRRLREAAPRGAHDARGHPGGARPAARRPAPRRAPRLRGRHARAPTPVGFALFFPDLLDVRGRMGPLPRGPLRAPRARAGRARASPCSAPSRRRPSAAARRASTGWCWTGTRRPSASTSASAPRAMSAGPGCASRATRSQAWAANRPARPARAATRRRTRPRGRRGSGPTARRGRPPSRS